ncbi:MAG: DUF222 domain-containing protein [Pseudomonadales bacterium]|jgi:hypothetical protein|nr:DUF222 domain-containing protein [Pseudomonadales bacterium]
MEADLLTVDDLSTLSDDQLVDAIVTFSGHMNAAEFRLIRLVGELDLRKDQGACGVDSIPAWLGYYCGLDGNAAREKLRVARALRELPEIRACFAAGEISYSKVRAITRVANASNEKLLLSYALGATAAQMERVVRGYRQVERIEDPETVLRHRRRRGLDWWFDDDGMLVIQGRLAPEDGALFIRAIEAVCTRMKADERAAEAEDLSVRVQGELDEEADSPPGARRADALVEILEAGLANPDAELAGGDLTLVVMHVPVGASQAAGNPLPDQALCELEHGPAVPHETACRIACDASVVTHHEHPDGRVASIGRRSRTVPYWLRRALEHRDVGCRFPGCNRTRHLDAHHVVHWAEGGETSLDNLLLLCRHHHRQIHDGRFHIRRSADGDVLFDTADGRPLPNTFPQKPGDSEMLVQMNVRRGLEIDSRTGSIADGYSPRPDYSGSVAALWRATHGDALAPPPAHPGHCAFWPRADAGT